MWIQRRPARAATGRQAGTGSSFLVRMGLPMPLAAFVAWLVTAGGGLCLAAIWLIEYDPSGAPTRLPKTVVTAHGLLAVAGLYVWWEYVSTEKSGLALAAVLILAMVTLLGFTMGARWIKVYRAHKNPSPAPLTLAAAGDAGRPNPVPPERHLPLPLVIAHGVLAMATIGLVLLAALDIGGN
jgi:hypothetical protein